MTEQLDQKIIEVTIEINSGTTAAPSYGEKITLSGLAMRVSVTGGQLGTQGSASIIIYGMTKERMVQLTTTGFVRQENKLHKIQIDAGIKGEALSTIFTGLIDTAFCRIPMPLSEFVINSFSVLDLQLTPVDGTSYKGSTQVSSIMSDLAKAGNLKLIDKGVSRVLDNPVFSGDTLNKIRKCAKAADIAYNIDIDTLTIWEKGTEKQGQVKVSAESGNTPQMIGVPVFSGSGLDVETKFFNGFTYSEVFEVDCKSYESVSGLWQPISITHDLECMIPNGLWFTRVSCLRGFTNV